MSGLPVPTHLADLHTRVELAPATVEYVRGEVHVSVQWQPLDGLDRLDVSAWYVGPDTPAKRRLAARLVRAIDAGVVVRPSKTYVDVFGRSGVHTSCAILARMMNADLRRLGY